MKENKGIGLIRLIKLIISIIILIVVIVLIAKVSMKSISKLQLKDLKTEMLQIQTKAKIYSEEVSKQTANLNDTNEQDSEKINEVKNTQLFGTKLSECSVEIQEKAQQAGIADFEIYYCLKQEDIENMEIDVKLDEDEYYLVKYEFEDTEIVYTKGFEYGDKVYYTLSELEEIDGEEN